ncbi:MAG: hypothetical protein KKB21_01645 [Nanoarchaeota archaeon]|nr:hypothetical protein [Nanoarchaeota archaeon]MBU4086260.1 hypothetical protein [Nanoarchaeota archaeon]
MIETVMYYLSRRFREWKDRQERTELAERMLAQGKGAEEIRERLGITKICDAPIGNLGRDCYH